VRVRGHFWKVALKREESCEGGGEGVAGIEGDGAALAEADYSYSFGVDSIL
jgi:hypothetical protein